MATDSLTSTDPQLTDAPDPRRWRALAVIAIAQLMIVLDASVVVVALPSAQVALHISAANRQWVLTAYTLAFGSLLLLGGRIADYVGRRRMFVIGLIGFGAASALGGLAQNQAMLFGARAVQGAFAAVMAPASLSLLTVTFTEAQGARPGVRRLRRGRRRRRRDRPRARRHADAVRVLALDPADQRSDRDRHRVRRGPLHPREQGGDQAQLRPPRSVGGHARALPARLRLHDRQHPRLGSTADARAADRCGHRAGSVRRDRAARPPPAAPAARRPRAQPRRLVPRLAAGRLRAARHVPLPDLLPAAHARLLGPDDRVRVPAVLRWNHRRRRHSPAHCCRGSVHGSRWSSA